MDQNIRGLEFRFHNMQTSILSILNFVDVESFIWHVPEDLVVNPKYPYNPIFDGTFVDGNLHEIIDRKEYQVIFINLRAFPIDKRIIEFDSYQDLMDSDCWFVMLCSDGYYAEIYCKDVEVLVNIYNKLMGDQNTSELRYKTDLYDPRTRLSVF